MLEQKKHIKLSKKDSLKVVFKKDYQPEGIEAKVSAYSYFYKPFTDFILSLIGVIVLSPLFVLLYFITIFTSKGPGLYNQKRVGLNGKAFIPRIIGFGCNVPAIMTTRTLESEKDRILTILITPFMSCSAKLPVYIILTGTFFSAQAGTVIFAIYLFGVVAGVVSGRLFRSTLLKGAAAPFVVEVPPYRAPMLKSVVIHMWDRSKMFLKKILAS